MISEYYPNPATKPKGKYLSFSGNTSVPTIQQSALAVAAGRKGISANEWTRRDGIVSQLARESQFKVGDKFFPPSIEDFEKYGECKVKYLAFTYQALEQDVWPDHDNPMVITASSIDEKHDHIQFNCTTNYPRKMQPIK